MEIDIRQRDNEIIVVPNGPLSNAKITNYITKEKQFRVTVNFGVDYGTSVEKVRKTVIPAMKKIKTCLKNPAAGVDFIEMGDSALLFKAKFWVKNISERYDAKVQATENIYNALNKAKIGIPYPQMDVHIKKK